MQRLTQDYLDRDDIFDVGLTVPGIDYSLPTQVLAIQKSVLNQLLSDTVAQRILDSQAKLPKPAQAFRLSELYAGLHQAIWSELKTGRDIDLFRRNLQREHVNRIASALVRPSGSMPADARSQLRVRGAAAAHRGRGGAGERRLFARGPGAPGGDAVHARRGAEGAADAAGSLGTGSDRGAPSLPRR